MDLIFWSVMIAPPRRIGSIAWAGPWAPPATRPWRRHGDIAGARRAGAFHPRATAAAALRYVPCAGNPTMVLRLTRAHSRQSEQRMSSRYIAGHVTTRR